MLLLAHLGLTFLLARILPGRSFWDYRAVLVGSMLPDLIDKPLGYLVLGLDNGRLVAHTLLFVLLLAGLGLAAFRAGSAGRRMALGLAFGSGVHLLLDGVPLEPSLLFWPLLGWEFPGHAYPFRRILLALGHPLVVVSETVGFFALLYLVDRHRLQRPVRWRAFLRNGRLPVTSEADSER